MTHTTMNQPESLRAGAAASGDVTMLVVAWSVDEPHRVGEIAVVPEDGELVLGRGDAEGNERRLRFFRQRPHGLEPTPPLTAPGISRQQLVVRASGEGVAITSVGRCDLRIDGATRGSGVVLPGQTLQLRRQLVLLCVRRPALLAPLRYFPRAAMPAFGEADAAGILGESPSCWAMRESMAFVAKAGTHALLVGPSGTGKELVARGIHALSDRATKPFVARNAATLPPGLIDAELFGNVRNYPNAGMPERPGLIGSAHGGVLFLDEIAELPTDLQSHLLRVLDRGGEYQRLGESTTRRSDFLLVGATNRDPSALKHDVLARLTNRIELPPLDARLDDVPLLARHILRNSATTSPEILRPFVTLDAAGRAWPRLDPKLVEHLVTRRYPLNVRELAALLWRAMRESAGDAIALPEAASPRAAPAPPRSTEPAPAEPPAGEPTADAIRAALAAHHGSVTRAARALGMSSRYALYRMMKREGIALVEESGE